MNDLQMIRELDDTTCADADDLGAARTHLLAAIDADPGRGSSRRRAVWIGATASGVAAATALILFAGSVSDQPGIPKLAAVNPAPSPVAATTAAAALPHSPTVATTVRPSTHSVAPTPSVLRPPPALRISAAAFMAKAAAAAKAAPDIAPRSNQFLYVKDGDYEAWLSMDGTHDGLIDNGDKIVVPGCRNGVARLGDTPPEACTVQPAYLADAPTTSGAMVAYIESVAGSSRPNSLGKELMSLAEFNYLRPAAKAALFGAAPLLPGLTLQAKSILNMGRPAVAVTWRFDGSSTILLFDPKTYALVGVTTSGEQGETAGSQIRQAVVDHVGGRP